MAGLTLAQFFPFSSLSPDLRLSPLLPILDIRKTDFILYTVIFAWLCFYICMVPWEKDYQLPGSFHFQLSRVQLFVTP